MSGVQLTVTRGGVSPAQPQASSARWLRLSAPAWAVLAGTAPSPAPPWFTPTELTDPDHGRGRAELAAAGALSTPGAQLERGEDDDARGPVEAVPELAASIALLCAPATAVGVAVAGAGVRRRAWLALGPAGRAAGLVELGAGAVELSAFPAGELARELVRLVPGTAALSPATATGAGSIVAQLTGAPPRPPVGGRVPWSAVQTGAPAAGAPRQVTAALAELSGARGSLTVDVWQTGVGHGQVLWAATPGGWLRVAAAPRSSTTEQRTVVTTPVQARDLPADVAVLLTTGLDMATGLLGAAPAPGAGTVDGGARPDVDGRPVERPPGEGEPGVG